MSAGTNQIVVSAGNWTTGGVRLGMGSSSRLTPEDAEAIRQQVAGVAIMLVSVTERTREIGIRLAVGARGRDVRLQFLLEATLISLAGGLIGVALGYVASKSLTELLAWPTLVSTPTVLVSFVFAAAIGIFFGWYPACKAASTDPIEALRFE